MYMLCCRSNDTTVIVQNEQPVGAVPMGPPRVHMYGRPMGRQHGRRRLPVDSMKAADTGFIQNLSHHGKFRKQRKLTEETLAEYYESYGIDRSNMWWVLPVSCFMQMFWIFVMYKIYKRCVRSQRTKNDDAQ